MGVTVMIIMGLLSVLAISSIDFDGLDEIRTRLEEAKADQEEENEVQDTSDLGWLDPDSNDTPNSDLFSRDLLAFARDDTAESAPDPNAAAPEPEAEDMGDDFDSFDDMQTDAAAAPFAQTLPDAANDLWPLEAQSEPEGDEIAEDEEDSELIELAGFDAAEDALELPYSQTRDADGNDIPPEVAVTHNNGWTDVRVNDETHSFAHSAQSDFTGLEPEDVLLRAA